MFRPRSLFVSIAASGLLLLLGAGLPSVALGQTDQKSPFSFSFGDSSPFGQVAETTDEPVQIEAKFSAAEDGAGVLAITATIAPGYHIYSLTQPAGGPGAAKILLEESTAYRASEEFVAQPKPATHIDHEVWEGLQIEEHTGTVTWFASLRLDPKTDPQSVTITGSIDLQACQASSCLPIEIPFTAKYDASMALPTVYGDGAKTSELSTTVEEAGGGTVASDTVATGSSSLFVMLGAALLGGLILNLMPCVLPVIGLKVLSFAEQAGHDRKRVLGMNLAYSAGLISVFLLLAGLASLAQLGLSNESYGWGELYTLGWFKISMVVLVFAMALSFLGVWEIPIPGFAGVGKANDLQAQEGPCGAFFKGVFTTILATPCSGPFLGPVFGYTLAQSPAVTFLVFLFVGLGMASPYLLIGLFPSLIRWLPKPGAWMETFKQLMGFVLMVTVVYLISTLAHEDYLPVLILLVAIGFACWWIGRTPLTASDGTRRLAWLGGCGTAVLVGWLAFAMVTPSDKELPWQPYSSAALSVAQQSGNVVLVDFTADWCLTCKLNLKRAINTDKVKAVIESNNVTPLLADWTNHNDDIKQAIEALGSRSIPLLAIYPAGKPNEPILLRDVISQEQLLEALQQAGAVVGDAMPIIKTGAMEPALH